MWWYVDALSDDGAHGLTLIAFIGSVFSPWYKWARRGGAAADPRNHVTMNVALYGRGGKRWAMTERGSASLQRDADTLTIGPSSLRWDGTALAASLEEVTAPLPSRIRGGFRLLPAGLATRQVALDGVGRHRWGPIAPGARIEVFLDQPALKWSGTAYFDTNAGDEPLEEGFVGWDWCRAKLPDGMAVLYHGVRRNGAPFGTALRYDAVGNAVDFDPPPVTAMKKGFWGVPRCTLSEGAPRVTEVLEDAPFYTRSVISTRLLGQDATAVHESLSLDRFVQPWVQFMLPFKAPRVIW